MSRISLSSRHARGSKLTELCTGALVYLCFHSMPVHASSPIYKAAVTDVNGVPCFNVQPSEFQYTPQLVVVEVFDKGGALVWEQGSVPSQPFVFSAQSCLPYGQKLDGKGEHAQPAPLRPSALYGMVMNVNVVVNGSVENRQYLAHFCIQETGRSMRQVHSVRFDRASDSWDLRPCGLSTQVRLE